jgi:hypothetical protein
MQDHHLQSCHIPHLDGEDLFIEWLSRLQYGRDHADDDTHLGVSLDLVSPAPLIAKAAEPSVMSSDVAGKDAVKGEYEEEEEVYEEEEHVKAQRRSAKGKGKACVYMEDCIASVSSTTTTTTTATYSTAHTKKGKKGKSAILPLGWESFHPELRILLENEMSATATAANHGRPMTPTPFQLNMKMKLLPGVLRLPNEVLGLILDELPTSALMELRQTCKRLDALLMPLFYR